MKYLRLFESPVMPVISKYLMLDGGEVTYGNSIIKREEMRKYKVIQKYLGVDSVSGEIDDSELNLSFGYASKNRRGRVVGVDIAFEINGDRGELNWVYVGYDYTTKEMSYDTNGPDLVFKINYCPVKDGKLDMEAFKETIKDLKSWIDDPELYNAAKKYNL
jgi:hypothetical protein